MQTVLSSVHRLPAEDWAQMVFGDVKLGDCRRTRRVVNFAANMVAFPGGSIPEICDSWTEIKSTYRTLARKEATPDALQKPARKMTLTEAAAPGTTTLFIEDTTTCSWPGNMPVKGLGPVGNGADGLQGYHLHSCLAVRWSFETAHLAEEKRPPVEVLGLAHQQAIVRKKRPRGSKKKESGYRRLSRERESQRWAETSGALGPCPQGVRWIEVADREGDLYPYLSCALKLNHDIVVRAAQNRAAFELENGNRVQLIKLMRTLEPSGLPFTLLLRGRNGEPSYQAHLDLSWKKLRIRRPGRYRKTDSQLPETLDLTIVRVFEPGRKNGLEWILLTSLPVESVGEAREIIRIYACRWIIEEFHKVLKSGLKIEELQLETAGRLMAAIAVKSIVALRLVDLREHVRTIPDHPAEESGLSQDELKILAAATKRELQTVREVALAIGRLGGHIGRRSDGMPGLKTLWRGLTRLHTLLQGARLAHALGGSG